MKIVYVCQAASCEAAERDYAEILDHVKNFHKISLNGNFDREMYSALDLRDHVFRATRGQVKIIQNFVSTR